MPSEKKISTPFGDAILDTDSDSDTTSKKNNKKKSLSAKSKQEVTPFGIADVDSDDSSEIENNQQIPYSYPLEKYKIVKKSGYVAEPKGTQWLHDRQKDDELGNKEIKLATIVEKLMNMEYPEQRSDAWFALRRDKITASDVGSAIGDNPYELPYRFLIKKVWELPFRGAKNCHHGTKYENIATAIYEYRRNVKVEEFGLIAHPKHIVAASPDGIVGKYKLDGTSLTKYVGRMLEIKCVVGRQIKKFGDIKGNQCPIYYWDQVQTQLECCDLAECDFWQCKIVEYDSKESFINDTDVNEPFRSKSNGLEKGCLLQFLPHEKYTEVANGKYEKVLYDTAKFCHPPKIEMTPYDCDIWISQCMANIDSICPKDYYFDRIKYWKLVESHCCVVERNKKWFADSLPILEKMWNYVVFFRNNKEQAEILQKYVEIFIKIFIPEDEEEEQKDKKEEIKINEKVMRVVDILYNTPNQKNITEVKEYNSKIKKIKDRIEKQSKDIVS